MDRYELSGRFDLVMKALADLLDIVEKSSELPESEKAKAQDKIISARDSIQRARSEISSVFTRIDEASKE